MDGVYLNHQCPGALEANGSEILQRGLSALTRKPSSTPR
jgi:hypothetical protein